jgi:lysophospholipid acyltransferase (LPLAT)-like uncharacterized protein
VIPFLATAWVRSLRARRAGPSLPPSGILVLWHADMLPCLRAFAGSGMRVLISQSRDGDLGARAAEALGYRVIRGSSSRGGAEALRILARELRNEGGWVALVADGPRGPRAVCKPGAVWLSQHAALPVVCAAASVSSGFTLGGWARVKVPLPFSRVTVRVSEAFFPKTTAEVECVLERSGEGTTEQRSNGTKKR